MLRILCLLNFFLMFTPLTAQEVSGGPGMQQDPLKISGAEITIFVVFVGLLVLLSEIGVDLTVVLGGAAVLSLVIAFGAQSLVKDYLSGFMILLENQYRVGNVVKINQTTGVVEEYES